MKKTSKIILPAYHEFWKCKKNIVVIKGSRGSGKSFQTALKITKNIMSNKGENALVIRRHQRTIKDSCYSDLQRAIGVWGADKYWQFSKSQLEATYLPTQQKILFRGLDDPLKIASVSVPKGALSKVWIEEAYQLQEESDFDMITESIRGIMPEGVYKQIILTFNPWNERHWLKKRFFDVEDDDIYTLTTTYKDNPYLSEDDYRAFEKMRERNPRRYRVAGLGEWGVTEGLIFENWEEVKEVDVNYLLRHGYKAIYGLDFGFTNPTALVCSLINLDKKHIVVFDEIYKSGLTNEMRATIIKEKGYGRVKIIADNESPESIAELNNLGLNVYAARKGKDSVRNGIEFLQNYKIDIYEKCENTLNEFASYSWKKDKIGNMLDEPEKENDHSPDALRYSCEEFIIGDDWIY